MAKRELYLDQMIGNDFKPVKCGGENTPLEISKGKVRCNYPLELSSLKVDGLDVDKWERYIVHCGWFGSSSKVYLPLNGYIIDWTSLTGRNEYHSIIAPFDGYLDFAIARSEYACGSTVMGFHKSSTGTEVPNSTATESITVDMADDNTSYKFQFSNATFDAGDILAISFDSTSSSVDTNATFVFKFDTKAELI